MNADRSIRRLRGTDIGKLEMAIRSGRNIEAVEPSFDEWAADGKHPGWTAPGGFGTHVRGLRLV